MMPSRKGEEFSCACINGHRTFGWRRSGFLLFLLGGFIAGAIVVPYISVVAQRKLPAFIPFISQAGGAPPQTGMLAIFLILIAFTGFFPFSLLYATINHRNRENSKWIRKINFLNLFIALSAFFGCIMTACFPVDYVEVPNQFEWFVTVLLEHSFAASLVLVGIVIYQFFLTLIWWLIPDASRTAKFTKLGFCIVYIIFFFIVLKPMNTFLYEEVGPDPFNFAKLKNVTSYQLPVEFSTSYIICAFFEWAVGFVSIIYFIVMFKDFQRISFHVTLRPKSCLLGIPEPATEMPLKLIS